MQIGELLIKYKDVQPKEFGDYVERSYPVSAVIAMMNELKRVLEQTDISGRIEYPCLHLKAYLTPTQEWFCPDCTKWINK